MSEYLRLLFPNLVAVGIDTHGSILFGHHDQKRLLRGLGNSIMPTNLKHAIFDEVHWVSSAEAFAATRDLHRRHSLFMGPTSGASYLVALWWARRRPDATTVALFADEGYRYQDTVYNDEWIKANNALLERLPSEPIPVGHPLNAESSWSHIHWNRRTYEAVLEISPHVKVR
jgi:cysteine synthase A